MDSAGLTRAGFGWAQLRWVGERIWLGWAWLSWARLDSTGICPTVRLVSAGLNSTLVGLAGLGWNWFGWLVSFQLGWDRLGSAGLGRLEFLGLAGTNSVVLDSAGLSSSGLGLGNAGFCWAQL